VRPSFLSLSYFFKNFKILVVHYLIKHKLIESFSNRLALSMGASNRSNDGGGGGGGGGVDGWMVG
jgi:uncharacterized membrane protein